MAIIICSFILSYIVVSMMLPRVLIISLRRRLIDNIDSRKVHSVPASRLGGVTFLPAMLFASWVALCISDVLLPNSNPIVNIDANIVLFDLALLMLYITGIFDDIIGVGYRKKFVVQIIAALTLVCSGAYFTTLNGIFGVGAIPYYIGAPLTILFYIFVINAMNLIDGIDGLASLLSIMGLAVYGTILYLTRDYSSAIIAFATMGALVPFCYANIFGIKRRARSKIFMGDTGSLVIGATLGFMAVKMWNISAISGYMQEHNIPAILAFTMLIVPCFDVVRIILHRYKIHQPIFMPDKNHIHHKFMAMGFTPHKALLSIIALNSTYIICNTILATQIATIYIMIIDVLYWIAVHIYLTKRTQKYQKRLTKSDGN